MFRFLFIGLIAVPTLAAADEIDASVDFTSLDRDEFVEEARRLGEASWEGSMSIFTRIDPSIAETVPPFPWNAEFEDAYGCVYDEMSQQGTLSDYNDMRDEGIKFLAFLEENPEVNLLNLEEYEEALDLMMPSDGAVESMQSCGLMGLNAQAMTESGLMQAVTQYFIENEE